jgi:nucleotide-binding universal stress UspA family protein
MVRVRMGGHHRSMHGSRILSVTRDDGPSPAYHRGTQIARACGAELLVARFAEQPALERGPAHPPAAVADVPLPPFAHGPVGLLSSILADTGRLVLDLDIAVVVVDGQLAPVAVALAEWLRIPVLVARATCGERIVIATDMEVPGEPVVSAGVRFAARLAVPATAVHNLPPEARDGDKAELRDRIVKFMTLRGVTRTVIARETSTPHAVFDVARAENADVIVVGTRRQRWSQHRTDGIPERLARGADCSVLVTPTGLASA